MGYPLDLDEYDTGELALELTRRRLRRAAGLCDYCAGELGQPTSSGAPSCRYPARHAGTTPAPPLTFDDLTGVNLVRVSRWHPGFPDDDGWTLADWSNAMLGEAGEAANIVKKLRRGETGTPSAVDPDRAELVRRLGEELADVVIYLTLLAAKAGVDLAEAIVDKFDAVSIREGYPDRLGWREA